MSTSTDFFDPSSRSSRARLAVAVELMRELSRYSDPGELSSVFAKRMNQLYPTSRQITLSRRGVEPPKFRITRYNRWTTEIDPYREQQKLPVLAGGLFGEFMAEDQPRIIDDLTLAPNDPAAEYLDGQRSVLAIPIFDSGKPASVVVLTREEPAAFPREQIPELVWLSNLFGRATQTLVLSHQLQNAYDTAEYELRTIEDFQQNLLPKHLPELPGLDVAVHYQTAHRAGGDYYDFFPLANGKLGVLIADVSGHGAPAAMLVAVAHSLAHGCPFPPDDPGEFLAYLNRSLASRYTGATGHFMTAVYMVIDPKNRTVTCSNAGHEAPRGLLGGSDGISTIEQPRRLPLGVTHRNVGPYPVYTKHLEPGDFVALYTDGLTESLNSTGEMFGVDRLDAHMKRQHTCASCVVDGVVSDLNGFLGHGRSADDRTLVVIGLTTMDEHKKKRHVAAAMA